MPLSPGDKLGPYEILAPLGAGGMGEVYRARDGKLHREVAIKSLPASLANDAQYMARFGREAQMLAALNHPNIATVYGIEQGALVMELVDGADLNGPLPVDEAISIARQIAAGLEAAHEKGIIHRDLKPANIKLTPAGVVKILDFGLAKSANESSAVSGGNAMGANPTISPTLSMEMTRAGMILGTAAYMSPEQARGKAVDKRTDIWAFGVVLYEIVTGKRLFRGEDLAETLASVMKDKPDLSAVPANVRRLLERCLEKDPKKRLRDIGDMELLLADQVPVAASARSRLGIAGWIAAGVMALGLGISLWAPWRAIQPVDRPLVRLDVDLGEDVSLPAASSADNIPGSSVVISADGMRLVFLSGSPQRIFTRRLDQSKAVELAGTQGGEGPFFLPDGQWIGFRRGFAFFKTAAEGGAVVPLGEFGGFADGPSWGEDGSFLVGVAGKGVVRIREGGKQEDAVPQASGDYRLAFPQLLPGGKAVLFSAIPPSGSNAATIDVTTLADGRRKTISRGGASPRYLATSNGTGYLAYVNNTTLYAVPFDPDKLETDGTAVPIVDDVASNPTLGAAQVSFSSAPSGHGTLVYRKANGGGAPAMVTLEWVDSTGRKNPLLAKPGVYRNPSLSPDGKRVVLAISDGGNSDIWVYDSQRDTMTRLTFGGGHHNFPIWSPDGQYVVFTSVGQGIFQTRADGAGQPQALTGGNTTQFPWSFTTDGKRLAYAELASNYQIWTVPLEDQGGRLKAGKPEPFFKSSFADLLPAFSPDGRWLAYESNESGRYEVYVRAFPPPAPNAGGGQGGKWQVSNNGGTDPHWSRNGHDLMYLSGDQIMAVSYSMKGDSFLHEKARVWMAKLGATSGYGTLWDLAPDGKRVAVIRPVETAESRKPEHEIVILQNFFDELRRKVPVAK
jgi:Protein kinase domain/WD40-like Beta Propeller Repeat